MNLREWAEYHDIHYRTALDWFHAGTLPVEAHRVGKLILVGPLLPDRRTEGTTAVYARVSSRDQSADLDRQVARLTVWCAEQNISVSSVVTEIGSALNGKRRKLSKLLADPDVRVIVVEHRDRFARFGFEMVQDSFLATGRRILVMEPDEIDDDLVRDMTEVLTSMCARLYGRRAAANRAKRAMEAAANG